MNQSKKRVINRLKKTYCRLAPSKISGIGVFAVCDIPKGTSVFFGVIRHKWLKFTKEELIGLELSVKKMIDDFFPTDEKNRILIPENGLNGIDISFFLNHSDNSNCYITEGGSFITRRDVRKGEELTSDYKTYDNNFKVWKRFKNLGLAVK